MTIDRILLLKLEHIGDLLIAAPALMLLRKSFAKAHITLICGPWNVGLARRMGIADEIHAVTFFSPNSMADVSQSEIREQRSAAAQQLSDLHLTPFDLAIDLRRDEDTREVLKLFDSRRYAGFGDLSVFSYLDVALPFARHGPAAGAPHVLIEAKDLDRKGWQQQGKDGLHLVTGTGTIDLSIETDQVWAPAEYGGEDWRTLGAALWRIDTAPIGSDGQAGAMSEVPRDAMHFGPGWLDWEPWGRWSSVDQGHVALRFPAGGERLKLAVAVQGHTSPSHDRATVRVRAGKATETRLFRAGDGPATLELDCRPVVHPPVLHSEPILLRGGRYRGRLTITAASVAGWMPLRLAIKGSGLGQTLAALRLPHTITHAGLLDFPFEVEIRDSAEPIVIELTAERPDHALVMGIVAVELDWMQGRLPTLPVTHMGQQLLDLAAMVALRFAPQLAADDGEVARRLRASRPASSAQQAVARLRRRARGDGGPWLRRKARTIVGVGIGANKATKLWPIENFRALIGKLLEDDTVDVALIGGPQERDDAAALAAQLDAGARVLDLCACCRIEDLGEVLAELNGFIGLDTGTTHFAGRAGLRTFAIFGASHDPREWGPVGASSGWAAADLPCTDCSKARVEQCDRQLACMTRLTPDEIWPAVRQTLFERGGASTNLILPEIDR